MTFFALAARGGMRWLVDVSDHAGRVITFAGLLVGVSVAGFFTNRGPLIALLAVAALALIAFVEGAFLQWRESERAREVVRLEHRDNTRACLVAMRSILVELEYIANRIEEGPLGDELLPNLEWVRHKDLIASERGDVFVELGRAYREADWFNRSREKMETMDEDEVESLAHDALEPIRDAQGDSRRMGERAHAIRGRTRPKERLAQRAEPG